MNAVALQSAVFNGASILGPALAGLALGTVGYSGNFFLNAASYLAVEMCFSLVKRERRSRGYSGLRSDFRWRA